MTQTHRHLGPEYFRGFDKEAEANKKIREWAAEGLRVHSWSPDGRGGRVYLLEKVKS